MDLIEKTKSYFRAYERCDPKFVADAMADGFTFTSPFDEHIGRDDYFRRCWPPEGSEPLHQKFEFLAASQEGDRVTVVYDCTLHRSNAVHPDRQFRNAEMHSFENGKLKSVEVFFGDPPGSMTRREFAMQSGAG